MKIRDGFVTNSSSTNFLIISKEELTNEYLLKKLGFKENSPVRNEGVKLVNSIINYAEYGLRWGKIRNKNPKYNEILELFGKKSADKYLKLTKKGYRTYMGNIKNEQDYLTNFMITDYFIIDDKDFYMDGRNCVW